MNSSDNKEDSIYKSLNENILANNPWLENKEPKIMGQSISRINYNWFSPDGGGEDYSFYEVGKNDCVRIEEHRSTGEGDKWYYDAYHGDGTMVRVFNPNTVIYKTK